MHVRIGILDMTAMGYSGIVIYFFCYLLRGKSLYFY